MIKQSGRVGLLVATFALVWGFWHPAASAQETIAYPTGYANGTLPQLLWDPVNQHYAPAAGTPGAPNVMSDNFEGTKATYSAAFTLTSGTAPTDIFALRASATKTIRIVHAEVECTNSTASLQTYSFNLHSTQDSGGTSAAVTAVAHDQNNDAAATASALDFTANPTLGTVIGTVRNIRATIFAAGSPAPPASADFGVKNEQSVVLVEGSTQEFVINMNTTGAATSCAGAVDWTEE